MNKTARYTAMTPGMMKLRGDAKLNIGEQLWLGAVVVSLAANAPGRKVDESKVAKTTLWSFNDLGTSLGSL